MPDTESTYLDVLESMVNALHRDELSEYWEGEFREGEWGGRHRLVQDWALLFAVLYDLTGDEEYLASGKDYLLDFGRGDHFAALHCGTAYEILQDELSETEREEFASGWVAGATSYLERRVGDPEEVAEWDHVSNHTIGACLYADYARHLFPDESDQYEYDRYTDPAWDAWWDRREFHEQASNYEGFTEAFLIHWAELRGCEDEFYDTPSVRNIFERNLRIVTPGGIVAPYGDSGYHQHLCSWIALFEKLASDTGDGRFADAAHDVRSYFRRVVLDDALETVTTLPSTEDIYNGRLIFRSHLHGLAWLGLAAHWHDPSVERVARPDPAGRIRRLPYGHVLSDSETRQLPEEKLVDGQVALTGGTPGSETYLLLSVGPELVHDHADAGAIQLLSRDDSVLLGTSGYLQRELLYHNTFYAQPSEWTRYPEDDHDRIRSGDEECRGRVEALRTEGETSHCRVAFERYHGLPIDVTREVDVAADGDVTLVDSVVAHEDGYRGGPLFHGEAIERRGDGTYRLRLDTLRSFESLESENPPGHLDVEFDAPAANIDVVRPGYPPIYEESYGSFPTTHYKQVWKRSYTQRNCLAVRRELEPGKTVFVTRLRPAME